MSTRSKFPFNLADLLANYANISHKLSGLKPTTNPPKIVLALSKIATKVDHLYLHGVVSL